VGFPFLRLPGLHVDASSEMACFCPCSHPAFRPSVFGFEAPLMVLPYLGAFKAWLYQPLLISLQVAPIVLRLPLLLIGPVTVWMAKWTWKTSVSRCDRPPFRRASAR
jgi:hypothetical protein